MSNRLRLLKNQLIDHSTTWINKIFEPFDLPRKTESLKGKTLFITGASRGIGLAIALKAAKEGANIAVVAKTITEQKDLPGTIYTAVEEINKCGGKGLAIQCDIRDENSVKKAVFLTVETFGGIDILVNNASAISLDSTESISMKKYDLMHSVNSRGTFLCTKYCIPYLKKSQNPHILTLSPPMNNIDVKMIKDFPAYSLAKYGMSFYTLAFSAELKEFNIAANCLWPRTAIATAAVQNLLGGDNAVRKSRTVDIMADAASIILNSDSTQITGRFFIDDEVLLSSGEMDLSKYNYSKDVKNEELIPDFFI